MSFRTWVISRTGGQTIVYLFYTTLISADIGQYEILLKYVNSGKGGIMVG